jgi:predicted O-methyltransferase YrrM
MRASSIPGLTKESELEILHALAQGMTADAKVVEVGSWLGRSTVAIHDGLPEGARLWAVDTFAGDDDVRATFGDVDSGDIRAQFDRNTAGCEGLEVIQASSIDASASFDAESLDWVFIDADHSYASVLADIRAWGPKLRRGGLISGHDYGRAGVTDAVRMLFPASSVDVSASIWQSRIPPRRQVVAGARVALRRLIRG